MQEYKTPSKEEPQKPMTDEEIKEALNVPPRDIESYPEIDKETQLRAGTFLYKLNLLASGADGNLQSLVWEFYANLDDYIHLDKEGSSIALARTIEDLKAYIQEHKNIIFEDIKK